jgi:hypothetical protein
VGRRKITIRLDYDLAGGDTELTVEPGVGVAVSRQPDGSWRVVELGRAE